MRRTYLYYVATASFIIAALSSFMVGVLEWREPALPNHWYNSPYFNFTLAFVFLTAAATQIVRIWRLKALAVTTPS